MSFIGFELGPLFNEGSILSQWCSLIASKVNNTHITGTEWQSPVLSIDAKALNAMTQWPMPHITSRCWEHAWGIVKEKEKTLNEN